MKTSYKTALVLGLGESGEAAAELLGAEGTAVTVLDRAGETALGDRARRLQSRGIRVLPGVETVPEEPFEVCIVSPGVPVTAPWIREVQRRGIPFVSELELGWSRRGKSRVVAVTGSNGKSTVVKWMAEILQMAGQRAQPAGNYGEAVSRAVLQEKDLDWLVLEVSSFQLETVRDFRADVGILLNVNPNHLDRHGDLSTYMALKARMFARTGAGDACVVHEPVIEKVRGLSGGKGKWISFGASATAYYQYAAGRVLAGGEPHADFRNTYFDNEILGVAAAAVVAGIRSCGYEATYAEKAARSFKPLPHRMEVTGRINGITFINDSKATNLSAMAAALRMLPGNVRLIAGGLVKEKDFSFVKEVLAKKAIGVYLIGQASEFMASAWSDVVPCFRCGTLEAAIRKARSDAKKGDTILLSPACASFDQFRNFEERGQRFARLMQDQAEEKKN